uniref:Uncharacterized protein n=1 Tax=Globodera pallida TaxID=36090 RepID=A0A183BJH4_GLOPA
MTRNSDLFKQYTQLDRTRTPNFGTTKKGPKSCILVLGLRLLRTMLAQVCQLHWSNDGKVLALDAQQKKHDCRASIRHQKWSSSYLPRHHLNGCIPIDRRQRQFSAQNAPKSPPPVPPAPQLSRHNTTDSATAAGQQNSTTEKFGASLNARLQRPQLVKAFTFNPTQSSSGNGDGSPKEFGASPPQSAGIEPHNCNGNLSADSRASSSESLDKQKKAGTTANVEEDDEFVCSLQFINCASKRKVPKLELCLWLGTSTGAVVAFQLQMPTNRIVSTVSVTPSEMFNGPKGKQQSLKFFNLGERGERLNSTIDATEQLRNNAQAIQSRSAKLLEKYEKRKWYQL